MGSVAYMYKIGRRRKTKKPASGMLNGCKNEENQNEKRPKSIIERRLFQPEVRIQ